MRDPGQLLPETCWPRPPLGLELQGNLVLFPGLAMERQSELAEAALLPARHAGSPLPWDEWFEQPFVYCLLKRICSGPHSPYGKVNVAL